jgi:cholinesterase
MIAQSGTAVSFFNPPPPSNSEAWYNASRNLGCGDTSVGAEASLACIRTKGTKELLDATSSQDPIQSVLGNFGPTADEKIVFSDYDDRGSSGDFIQKPLLVGNNNNEAGLFRLFALAANRTFTDFEWCLFNADIFTCPAAKAARYRVENGVGTYRYRYYGDFYNLRLTNTPDSGAWHGAELPVLFQSAEESSGVPNTPEENAISNYMQGAWAAFAKDPENAFSKSPYKLPPYHSLSM